MMTLIGTVDTAPQAAGTVMTRGRREGRGATSRGRGRSRKSKGELNQLQPHDSGRAAVLASGAELLPSQAVPVHGGAVASRHGRARGHRRGGGARQGQHRGRHEGRRVAALVIAAQLPWPQSRRG